MRLKCAFCVMAGLVVGAVFGYCGGAVLARRADRALLEEVLHGPPERAGMAAMGLLQHSNEMVESLLCVFADYRGADAVPPENKMVVAQALELSKTHTDFLPSLALGAFQDPDPYVREECVRIIREFWRGPFLRSANIMTTYLDLEKNANLREEKRLLLESILLSARNSGDSVEELEVAEVQERCKRIIEAARAEEARPRVIGTE